MLRTLFLLIIGVLMLAQPIAAQKSATVPDGTNPLIDFNGHVALVTEVQRYRENRLITLEAFREMAAQNGVLVLDARSAAAFEMGHIDGAVNLPLPDFTAASLAEVIGQDMDRPILIYCNNNFSNNVAPVVSKLITVALNVQTMTNLYGYGYRNIYELGEAVDFNDPQVAWVGTMAGAFPQLSAE